MVIRIGAHVETSKIMVDLVKLMADGLVAGTLAAFAIDSTLVRYLQECLTSL
jgi:hypothetical protein